jgi:hypothetical protein
VPVKGAALKFGCWSFEAKSNETATKVHSISMRVGWPQKYLPAFLRARPDFGARLFDQIGDFRVSRISNRRSAAGLRRSKSQVAPTRARPGAGTSDLGGKASRSVVQHQLKIPETSGGHRKRIAFDGDDAQR